MKKTIYAIALSLAVFNSVEAMEKPIEQQSAGWGRWCTLGGAILANGYSLVKDVYDIRSTAYEFLSQYTKFQFVDTAANYLPAVGATIGSVIPVIGTATGTIAGTVIGGLGKVATFTWGHFGEFSAYQNASFLERCSFMLARTNLSWQSNVALAAGWVLTASIVSNLWGKTASTAKDTVKAAKDFVEAVGDRREEDAKSTTATSSDADKKECLTSEDENRSMASNLYSNLKWGNLGLFALGGLTKITRLVGWLAVR